MAEDFEQVVSGIDELGTKLESLDLAIQKNILTQCLKASGEEYLKPMVERCPVSTEDVSDATHTTRLVPGALKRDLKVRLNLQGAAPAVFVGAGKKTFHVLRWIEYGYNLMTRGRKKSRKVIKHIPAKPFVRPAYDEATPAAVEAFANTLSAGIGAEWKNDSGTHI